MEPLAQDHTDAAPPSAATYDPAFPLARLRESPHNPRKHYGDLSEMAASVLEKGILSPLLVRPVDGDLGGEHEIVFGHRRYRAAHRAGLLEVPVNIRTLSDREASEMQIIENSQREDLHPLEEADGYRLLHDEFNYTVESLAAKIGKSPSYVYGRLKLAQLGPEAREGYVSGKYQLAVALTLAQLSDPKLQAAAALEVSTPRYVGAQGWTTAEARQHILRKYMLRLESAPFPIDDAQLVPAAGSCLACPKNTGRQVALFPTEPTEALCTDGVCFEAKRAAGWVQREAHASLYDERVLSEAEVKKLDPNGGSYLILWNSPYVDLNAVCSDDPKRRTHVELLKGQKFPKALARTSDGEVHELLEKKLLPKLLKAAGHDFDKLERELAAERAAAQPKGKGGKPAVDPMKAYREQEKKRKAEAELRDAVTLAKLRAARDAVLGRAVAIGDDRAFWQWLSRMLVMRVGYSANAVVDLRALKSTKGKSDEALLLGEASVLSPSGSKIFIVDLLTAGALEDEDEEQLVELEKFLKLNFEAIEKRVRDEAAKPAAPAKATTPAKGKASTSKPAAKTTSPAKASSKPATPAVKSKPAKRLSAKVTPKPAPAEAK